MRVITLLTALSTLLMAGGEFPGRESFISPNKHYAITCMEFPKDSQEYQLIFENQTSKKTTPVYKFGRFIEVTWSPRSKYFAITDHLGSNLSEVVVISVSQPTKPIPIPIPTSIQKRIGDHNHVYVRFHRWLSDSKLQLSIDAHDSNSIPPFKGTFEYVLPGK